jgi:hypothetical protein
VIIEVLSSPEHCTAGKVQQDKDASKVQQDKDAGKVQQDKDASKVQQGKGDSDACGSSRSAGERKGPFNAGCPVSYGPRRPWPRSLWMKGEGGKGGKSGTESGSAGKSQNEGR